MEEILRLFHQYKDAVYRLALSLTGSAADAEDVTQTVFLKLMEKQPELVPGKEPGLAAPGDGQRMPQPAPQALPAFHRLLG